ncbi:MAG: restriction endonuclease subunit S [Candidatus Binataceae bacterium]
MRPASWKDKSVGEVLRLEYGKPLENAARKPNGKYPVYGANGEKDRSDKFYFGKPSIIVGRKGSAGEITLTAEKFWPLDVTYFVTFDEGQYDLSFLYHLLTTLDLPSLAKGVKPGINRNEVYSQVAKIPSLPEQRRIVGIIDEAFAGIAAAKTNAEKNLQNARALFESHLQSVFSQRGDGWVEEPIGDVAEVFDGPHATPKTVDTGPVFLGISALQDGRINLGETRHVTPEDFKRWTRRVRPQADDVVFSYETRLGQAAIIPSNLQCCLGRRMGLVRVDRKRLDPRFFVYQYISAPFREFLASRTVRGATVDRIPLKEFPSFPIYLPRSDEQELMADQLETLRDETEHLESIYRGKLLALDALKKSLLHQAFTGQL